MKHRNYVLLGGSQALCVSNLFPSADKDRAEIKTVSQPKQQVKESYVIGHDLGGFGFNDSST